ncbi:MAG: hypothetical protein ACFFBD_24930, partial [Candidatus Hodarchaeota archaeon]
SHALIQLDVGPFFYDVNQKSYYAFNINKFTHKATYHFNEVIISISKNNSTLSNQTIVIDESLYLQQDVNNHTILSAVLVDNFFYEKFGDLQKYLWGIGDRVIEYNNETYLVKDLLNLTFSGLPLSWTPNPPSALDMLPVLPSLMKAELNLSANWRKIKGTYKNHHGFDLAVGLSGKQSLGTESGLSYVPSNFFVVFGGWYETDFLERELDLEGIQMVFLHEFLHTLGINHVPELSYLMSPYLSRWTLHNQTYQGFLRNINQYTGLQM